MKKPLPLAAPLFLVAIMWLVFVGFTGWVYLQTHHGGGAPGGSAGPPTVLELDPAGYSRLAPKLQWAGLASLGVLIVLILIGVRMGDKKPEE